MVPCSGHARVAKMGHGAVAHSGAAFGARPPGPKGFLKRIAAVRAEIRLAAVAMSCHAIVAKYGHGV